MNTIGLVYFSNTGNTKALAEAFRSAVEAKGGSLYFSEAAGADKAAFSAADVWVFGSPASGTEEVNDTEILPLIEELKDGLKGKKVFLFGSYGWGGGAFMDAWKLDMEGRGAVIAAEPVTCLEAPDGEAEDAMKKAAESLLG